jgi:ABC-type phosphate/phosphonate transport system permease subunit
MFATALVGTWRSAVLACVIGVTLAASEAKLGPLVQLLRGSRAFARVINRTDRKP